MADKSFTLDQVVSNPDFSGLSLPEKNSFLMEHVPEFSKGSPASRSDLLNSIHYGEQSKDDSTVSRFGQSFASTLGIPTSVEAAKDMAKTLANPIESPASPLGQITALPRMALSAVPYWAQRLNPAHLMGTAEGPSIADVPKELGTIKPELAANIAATGTQLALAKTAPAMMEKITPSTGEGIGSVVRPAGRAISAIGDFEFNKPLAIIKHLGDWMAKEPEPVPTTADLARSNPPVIQPPRLTNRPLPGPKEIRSTTAQEVESMEPGPARTVAQMRLSKQRPLQTPSSSMVEEETQRVPIPPIRTSILEQEAPPARKPTPIPPIRTSIKEEIPAIEGTSRLILTDQGAETPVGGGHTLHEPGNPNAYRVGRGSLASIPTEVLVQRGPILERNNDPSYMQELKERDPILAERVRREYQK